MFACVVCQVVLTLAVAPGGAVRFGFPLPAEVARRGLAVEGPPGLRVQWRPLQAAPDPHTRRQWCEVVLGGVEFGAATRVVLRLGGVAAASEHRGDVLTRSDEQSSADGVELQARVWVYADGAREQLVRRKVLEGELEVDGERLCAGEAHTAASAGLVERTLRAHIAPQAWASAGVIPMPTRLCAPWRDHLVRIAKQLRDLPGIRGAGDYARSGGVVTNLEFDTALGFARLGLACGESDLLARALVSARHLVDHDLDAISGLPFSHGPDHRVRSPEPGHAWLQGLLLTGCVFADDLLIDAAGSMAQALARQPRAPPVHERDDRARDLAWPLLELEVWLRFRADVAVRRAADSLAAELLARFDPRAGVLRFGEGERAHGAYEERAWLTGGIVLPALRAHLLRTGDSRVRRVVHDLESRLLTLLRRGQTGLPIRYFVAGDGLGSEFRLTGVPEGFLVVEGLASNDLKTVLARGQVAVSLEGVPDFEDPDVATAFSMAARCSWVLR